MVWRNTRSWVSRELGNINIDTDISVEEEREKQYIEGKKGLEHASKTSVPVIADAKTNENIYGAMSDGRRSRR